MLILVQLSVMLISHAKCSFILQPTVHFTLKTVSVSLLYELMELKPKLEQVKTIEDTKHKQMVEEHAKAGIKIGQFKLTKLTKLLLMIQMELITIAGTLQLLVNLIFGVIDKILEHKKLALRL